MFGSVGAGRVLAAVTYRRFGARKWSKYPTRIICESSRIGYGLVQAAWYVGDENAVRRIDRATARLLLRGLLAEGMARELVEWLHVASGVADSASGQWGGARFEALQDVIAKLRELGLEVTK
jgi:hypothetical protein